MFDAEADTSWRTRAGRVDAALALAIGIVQVLGTYSYSRAEPVRWELDAFALVLLMAGPAALLFRRRSPGAVLAVAFAAAALYAASGYPRGPAGFPAFGFAVANAMLMGRQLLAWSAVGVACPAFAALPDLLPDRQEATRTVTQAVSLVVWLPLLAAASEILRIRGERAAERARAERERASRRATDERLRVARELHDVLAHNISLIGVRSGVALHLLDERPDQARPALEAINAASEEALRELRSALDVLGREPGEDGPAPLAPTAGVRDLDGLVRRMGAAGIDVRVTVGGESRQLPPEVDLAAFRVVQEALTNVVRHAGREANATVRLEYSAEGLTVRVEDDGGGHGHEARVESPGAGRGIAGMHQRVDALGGTFAAGRRARGFRVEASFPIGETAR